MADITTITFEGEDAPGTQGGRIKQALDDALTGKHKLSEDIAAIEGMSGQLYRRLINNLVALTPDARYLETGSLKGSTSCSAMYKNRVTATCIENFHWDYRDLFYKNTKCNSRFIFRVSSQVKVFHVKLILVLKNFIENY